jgi:hypothetical protein
MCTVECACWCTLLSGSSWPTNGSIDSLGHLTSTHFLASCCGHLPHACARAHVCTCTRTPHSCRTAAARRLRSLLRAALSLRLLPVCLSFSFKGVCLSSANTPQSIQLLQKPSILLRDDAPLCKVTFSLFDSGGPVAVCVVYLCLSVQSVVTMSGAFVHICGSDNPQPHSPPSSVWLARWRQRTESDPPRGSSPSQLMSLRACESFRVTHSSSLLSSCEVTCVSCSRPR